MDLFIVRNNFYTEISLKKGRLKSIKVINHFKTLKKDLSYLLREKIVPTSF